jgi:hypothetical protein
MTIEPPTFSQLHTALRQVNSRPPFSPPPIEIYPPAANAGFDRAGFDRAGPENG